MIIKELNICLNAIKLAQNKLFARGYHEPPAPPPPKLPPPNPPKLPPPNPPRKAPLPLLKLPQDPLLPLPALPIIISNVHIGICRPGL